MSKRFELIDIYSKENNIQGTKERLCNKDLDALSLKDLELEIMDCCYMLFPSLET